VRVRLTRSAKGIARLGTALLACALFSVASLPATATPRPRQQPLVVVVGDSITEISAGSIHAALGSRYHDVTVYHEGWRIDQMLPALNSELAAHGPVHAVVENLGTNDALQGGRHADWQTGWTELLTKTAKVPCVVLTTVSLWADRYGKHSVASAIDAEIANLAKSDPTRYKVVDWNDFLTGLSLSSFGHYMRQDAIHPRLPGTRWIADEDQAALSDCGSSVEPPVLPPSKRLLLGSSSN
jgi:hypothetical protein